LAELITVLKEYEAQHEADPVTFYKAQKTRVKEFSSPDGIPAVDAAALMIYLNRAAFNGIWRLNQKGEFNTPWNQKLELNLASRHIEDCSHLLRTYATIEHGDFEATIMANLNPGTFFYIDPPYIPLTLTASFTSYTEEGWSTTDNDKLLRVMRAIDDAGCKFMMSNSTAPFVKELFGHWNIVEIEANRMIKASSDRPTVKESLVTNYV
jgi:DNA adenine methylase